MPDATDLTSSTPEPKRSPRRCALKVSGFIFILLAAYLLFWPVPADPAAWSPPPDPGFTGPYEANTALASAERRGDNDGLGPGWGLGPEDVAIDATGRMYTGFVNGRIVRFDPDEPDDAKATVVVDTGGRPLGLHFDSRGQLVVADAERGLLSVDPDSGALTVLATEHDGVPFKYTDDLDIAADGRIYFSDASWKFGVHDTNVDLLEHRANGRLLVYDPRTQTTELLLDDLYFANGVALSPDESFVLVCETGKYRVRRYWLTGAQAGTNDMFIDNLPAFPDGVSCNNRDTFWVALIAPRSSRLDRFHPHPWIKRIMLRLPRFLHPPAVHHGALIGLDLDGNVIHNLQDSTGEHFATVTSVEEHDGWLYLGSLELNVFGRIRVPER